MPGPPAERTPYTNTCSQNNYKFEGKERDTETGNDEFAARYYSNRFGRWLSSDWSAVPVPVPYANLINPQTLNLYAMVADDPESFADLDGHGGVDIGADWPIPSADAFTGCGVHAESCESSDQQDRNSSKPKNQTAQQPPPQQQKHHHHKPKPKPPNRKPGSKPARIIFNETSGLRPGNNNPEDLHDARVSIAHTLLNASGMRHRPRTVGDTLTASAARAIGRDPDAMAAWSDSQAATAEASAGADNTSGAIHFFLDYPGVSPQAWATPDREVASYGPFINVAGGGDVPVNAVVTIRIFTADPQY